MTGELCETQLTAQVYSPTVAYGNMHNEQTNGMFCVTQLTA